MNRDKIKMVRMVVDNILKLHKADFEKAGITISTGSATFGDVDASMKLKILDLDSSGKAVDLRAKQWNTYAELYGMKKEWLGKLVMLSGRPFTIVGLDMKKRKNPVIIESMGKTYITTMDVVIRQLGGK